MAQNWEPPRKQPQPNSFLLLFPSPQSYIKPSLRPPLDIHSHLPHSQKYVYLTLKLKSNTPSTHPKDFTHTPAIESPNPPLLCQLRLPAPLFGCKGESDEATESYLEDA